LDATQVRVGQLQLGSGIAHVDALDLGVGRSGRLEELSQTNDDGKEWNAHWIDSRKTPYYDLGHQLQLLAGPLVCRYGARFLA
jgi:hypothetical protein